ncbi:hypothetical protein [Corynebacterium nuruki]|uniref:hypothetical protein n=1 Tax=Corynebacterium nuruki TaxID=1032851 RepID=UPI001111A3E3|nr:hypothetical protein [Corynebacterium nuruki]
MTVRAFSRTRRARRTVRTVAAALAATGLLSGAVACGSDDGDDSSSTGAAGGDSSTAPSSAASGDPSDLMLQKADAPAGYGWNNVADVFDEDDDSVSDFMSQLRETGGDTVDPAECSGIVPDENALLLELHDHPDTTAVTEFLPHDDNDRTVIDGLVSTAHDAADQVPDDLSRCATFTRTSSLDPSKPPVTYHAQASDGAVVGAQDVHVITVVEEDPASPDNASDPVIIVTGTAEGVFFRVSAVGLKEPQILLDLADRQVARITGQPATK